MLKQLEYELRKQYSIAFLDIKKEINDILSNVEFSKDMTPIERYNLMQKYDRLNNMTNKVSDMLNVVNRVAVKKVNFEMQEIYKYNYNEQAKLFSVLIASMGIKKHIDLENSTEAKEDLKDNQSPFNELAIDNAKDIVLLRYDVEKQIINGLMNGERKEDIIKRLRKTTELKLNDIVRIAETQATRVENLGIFNVAERLQESGFKIMKTWNSRRDNKVREAHAIANGQTIPLNKPFIVDGEKLMYPGDPNGSAGNIINCRCYITTKIIK